MYATMQTPELANKQGDVWLKLEFNIKCTPQYHLMSGAVEVPKDAFAIHGENYFYSTYQEYFNTQTETG